jgi:enolase
MQGADGRSLSSYKTSEINELCRIEKDLGQKIKLAKIER